MSFLVNYVAVNTLDLATHRFNASWKWYVIRAAGFVSAGLILLLMISGIGHITGLTYRFIEPVKAWTLHKSLAIALCFSVAVHVIFILFDHFVKFNLADVTIPLLSHYNNGTTFLGLALGSFAVSFGIISMYLIVTIVLSSLGWVETRKVTWHRLHYLGYALVILVFLHGLYIGSDLKHGVLRYIWIGAGIILLAAIISRLLRVKTLD